MKKKINKFLSLLIFLVALLTIVHLLYFFFPPDLISPKSTHWLNPEAKLQTRISTAQNLNYSDSKTLPSLNNLPRYLAYNPKTGKVYAAKNKQESFSPASFTKLLTVQVALDLLPPEQYLTATPESVNQVPTILGLKPGEQLTINDLVRASITTSANDAAQTLAKGVAGLYALNPNDFVNLMNKKASNLNMKNSQFTNPDGLDDQNQYSTLEDIVKLIHNVQQNYPEILKSAVSDNQDIEKSPFHNHYYLPNWNGLLNVYPGVNGLKIAYTENAGYSTIVTAERQAVSVVVILSGADSFIERDLAAAALLDHAFVQENIVPAKITRSQIKRRYQQWAALAAKIRQQSKAD